MGGIIVCPDCDVDLEIVAPDPAAVEMTSIEQDWGEWHRGCLLTYPTLRHRITPNMQLSQRFFFGYYFYGSRTRLPLVALKK